MSETLEAILSAIEQDDALEAVRILTEENLDGVATEDLDRLVRLALREHDAHEYYLHVVANLSPEVQMELAKDLGTHSPADDVKDVVEKEDSVARLDAIVRAFIEQDEELGELYFDVIERVSPDVQAAYNTALGASSETDYDVLADVFKKYPQHSPAVVATYAEQADRDDIAELIKLGGKHLPDDLVLKLARAMQRN